MRAAALLSTLAMLSTSAVAEDVAATTPTHVVMNVAMAPATPVQVLVPIDGPRVDTLVLSGMPLQVEAVATVEGAAVKLHAVVTVAGEVIDPSLDRGQRRLLRSFGPGQSWQPTMLFRPDQQAEFQSGGSVPDGSEPAASFYGLQLTMVTTGS